MPTPARAKPQPIPIGINLLLFGSRAAAYTPGLLNRLSRAGYRHVEVPVFGGPAAGWRKLGRMISVAGMSAGVSSAMPLDASLVAGETEFRRAGEFLRRLTEAAEALGARQVIGPLYHPLGNWAKPARQEVLHARLIRRLRLLGRHFEASGRELVLEPLNRFETNVLNTQADADRICAEVGAPWLGWMSDSFHAHIEESSQSPHPSPYWRHVHASESHRGTAGTGQVRWSKWAGPARARHRLVVFEAFASRQGPLAAATRIWRDVAGDPLVCASASFQFLNRLLNSTPQNDRS